MWVDSENRVNLLLRLEKMRGCNNCVGNGDIAVGMSLFLSAQRCVSVVGLFKVRQLDPQVFLVIHMNYLRENDDRYLKAIK